MVLVVLDDDPFFPFSGYHSIVGNYIGTDCQGSGGLGNGLSGIRISSGLLGDWIGGPEEGAGNVISGNWEHGILAEDSRAICSISGNLIGTDARGEKGLGNGMNGIIVEPVPEKIAKEITELFKDKERMEKLGGEAKRIVEEDFTWSRAVDEYLQIYNRGASRWRGQSR